MALLTIQQTARLLNVSPITVRRSISSGYLPALRTRGEWRVRREMLDRFIKPVEARPRRVMPWAPNLGKPLTENDSLWNFVGMAGSEDEPKTDVASNKHKYLAEAYAARAAVELHAVNEE